MERSANILTPRWICFPGAIPLAIFLLFAQTGLERETGILTARPGAKEIVGGYQRRHRSDGACIACYYRR
ncbi:hypothetical protein ACLB1M_13750 [Escherichia coli]